MTTKKVGPASTLLTRLPPSAKMVRIVPHDWTTGNPNRPTKVVPSKQVTNPPKRGIYPQPSANGSPSSGTGNNNPNNGSGNDGSAGSGNNNDVNDNNNPDGGSMTQGNGGSWGNSGGNGNQQQPVGNPYLDPGRRRAVACMPVTDGDCGDGLVQRIRAGSPQQYEVPLPPTDCAAGYQRTITPETLMGLSSDSYHEERGDKVRMLPPWIATTPSGTVAMNNNDYNAVGVVGQMRAVYKTLFALGLYQGLTVDAVNGPAISVATLPAALANIPTLGIRIRWGIALLNYAPFELTIATGNTASGPGFGTLFGGVGANQQSLDRNITVTLTGTNGGLFYIPLAQRANPGMSFAQPAIGVGVDTTTVTFSGIPTAILASFSASVQLITAFHANAASFARALGIFDGPLSDEQAEAIYNHV